MAPLSKHQELISAPVGIPHTQFRAVCIASGVFWSAHGLTPTPQGLIQMGLTSLPLKEVKKIMETTEFSIAMQTKGIPWDQFDKLSEKQLLCLEVVTNPVRKGTLQSRLRQIGVSETEYRAWLRHPLFAAQHKELTKGVLLKWTDQIDTAIVQGAMDGKLENAKYINELTGRHDPNRRQAVDVTTVLRQVVEIIQVNMLAIDDSQVRNQILNGIATGLETILRQVNGTEEKGPVGSFNSAPGTGMIAEYRKEILDGDIYE